MTVGYFILMNGMRLWDISMYLYRFVS